MGKMQTTLAAAALLAALNLAAFAAPRANDGRRPDADAKVTSATFGPKRTKPVFTGPFQVDLVVVAFPDCRKPEVADVLRDAGRVRGHTVKEYFDEYAQGVTYPVLSAYNAVYTAPEPLGHYCRYDYFGNKIGYKDLDEGAKRAAKLKEDALAFARKSAPGRKPGQVTCHVFCKELDAGAVERLLRAHYPKPGNPRAADPIRQYAPKIPWADPLWPNSSVQTHYPGDGGTLVHELGHVLGAPDFYHATEEHDGVEGSPSLPWAWGPTGPAYCRYIYQALVPKECYPTFSKEGEYTLDPRSSPVPRGGTSLPVLGCFVPTAHPNYVLCIEYAHGERAPVGREEWNGLLVSAVNVTMASPLMGPPDLCYTYRRGDVYMKGGDGGGDPFLHEGDSFTLKSDPAARLPPLIPAGVELTDIREADGRCSFRLSFTKTDQSPKFLKDSLIPRVRLLGVDEVMPTSMHASCDVMYRGEPLLDEYGFVWGVSPNPTVAGARFPLYHRDRYDTRILGLKPGTKYYVRAYVKNASGVTYSKREIEVATPAKAPDEVPPLLTTDRLSGNWHILQWHFGTHEGARDTFYTTANGLIALMSVGIYHGQVPGGGATARGARQQPSRDRSQARGGRGGRREADAETGGAASGKIDIRRVHTNPSATRPGFRMADYNSYYGAMRALAKASGLADDEFENMAEWQAKCAKALGVKEPKKAFAAVATAAELDARRAEVKAALDRSQPVLLVRESTLMPGDTEARYPLDTAIIDGFRDGEWHAVHPLGRDRGTGRKSGWCSSSDLMEHVTGACLFFYVPSAASK